MRLISTIFVTMCVLSTLSACSDHTSTQKRISDSQTNIDDKTPKENESSEEEVLTNDPNDDIADGLYMGARGSGEGTVTLVGALAINSDKLDSRVSFTSLKNQKEAKQLWVIPSLREQDMVEDGNPSYINLGCNLDGRSEVAGMEKLELRNLVEEFQVIAAKVVFICDEKVFRSTFLTLSAETLILSNLNVQLAAGTVPSAYLKTKNLILEGKNSFQINKADDEKKSAELVLASEILSGDGSLNITIH